MEVFMIFSKLGAKDPYTACPKAIREVLHFFETTDVLNLAPGRYELQGDDVYVNVMDMTTHPFEGSHPEVHQKYIANRCSPLSGYGRNLRGSSGKRYCPAGKCGG